MKTGIATVSIAGDFSEKLAAIATAGFDGIEIFENDFLAFDGTPRDVARMVHDHGLEIMLFQPFRDFEGLAEPIRDKAFERARRKFDLMQELGTGLVLICSNTSPDALGGIDRCADDLAELGELAAKMDIRIGYEALAWGKHVSDHRDAWEIVRRADHKNVGLILDSFHSLARKTDPNSIRSIPGDKIFFVQLADAPLIDMDLLYWSRHFRTMPGQGDLDVTAFMSAVAATGYAGPVSLEIFNDQFRGGSPKSISVDGHRSLVYLMDQVQRQVPQNNISPPSLPERQEVSGVSFVEFGVDQNGATELEVLLQSMGFVERGRHVSKDVSLWVQGNIHLVINREQEGFAYNAQLLQGAGVCAFGISVADTTGTLDRARGLGAKPFVQTNGPGEAQMPAIQGLGESLIYFTDGTLAEIWKKEFAASPVNATQQNAGLVSVDHVAQTMDHEALLTWVLFYTSIFQTEKHPIVDVIDPAGIVRSQVIENASGNLRLALNGVENNRTFAGNFVNEKAGSAVQHIAFCCENLMETARTLKARGFPSLAVSTNYYADLEARLGLDQEFVRELRDLNVLYDRDETGEFFQLFSTSVHNGFFFELVERRQDYKGYGAPNAAFRIAAQKRAKP